MAGDWIKMRNDLSEDPAVIGIGEKTNLDSHGVVGRLHKLWSWADRQSRDGHASSVTEKWIDRYVERDGFAEAMASEGWLDIKAAGISFPNFDRHNGQSAKKRALAADRQRNARVTKTSRNKRDESVTREEKRRKKPPVSPLNMPAGISPSDWQAFRDHRSANRKKLTPRAEELALAKLHHLAAQGFDPKKLLNNAIESGWATFYERDDCRTAAPTESPKAEPCPCGAAGTVKVGGKWRCNDHIKGLNERAAA